MERGTLVSFSVKGQLRAGVVEEPEGKQHFKAVDATGHSHTLHPREMDFISSDYKIPEKPKLAPAQLGDFLTRCEELKDAADLASAWEILEPEKTFSRLEDLADLLFGSVTLENAWVLFQALKSDKFYFKNKAELWEPRPAAQVAELKKQAAAQESKAREQDLLALRLRTRLASPEASLEPEDLKKIESLKKFALWGEEAPEKNAAYEVLTILERQKTDQAAFQALVDLHVWQTHENLDLHRAGLNLDFPSECLEAAQNLLASAPADVRRRDPTALRVFTIDDETTTEVDDGLSVTVENGRTTLWIHIADPGRWVLPQSVLEREARARGSTVYLPDRKITMFPPILAQGPMSLNAGQTVPALSFAVDLEDTGAVGRSDVLPALIRPARRLSYEEADRLLASGEEPDLNRLAEAASLRKTWREARGAIGIELPEMDLKADPAGEITIAVRKETPSQELVSELMVLAGETAARFSSEHGLAVPYRVQPIPEGLSREALEALPEGPVRAFATLKTMSRSTFSETPGPHGGLGLDAYVQATSPIRRYADLFVHYQIKAWLETGSPVWTAEDLATMLPAFDSAGAQAAKLERAADRYWVIEYLRRQKGRLWNALVLETPRPEDRWTSVLLEDIAYRTNIKLSKDHAAGARLKLKVTAADPRRDLLNFSEG